MLSTLMILGQDSAKTIITCIAIHNEGLFKVGVDQQRSRVSASTPLFETTDTPSTSPYSGTDDISLASTLDLLASASGTPPSGSENVPALCD
ncbi:hypothetical protein EMCRGX_G016754 [Ephydatia muelleri]